MAKTYEQKREAFQRMLEGRLSKAVKSVALLANLSRKSDYAWTSEELQQMCNQLDDAVDTVMQAFGVDTAPPPTPQPVSEGMVGPVPGHAKRAIADALEQLVKGNTREGTIALRKIVLGWSPTYLTED